MKDKKKIVIIIIILILILTGYYVYKKDLLSNLFKEKVTTVTNKEVTVTDKGIADAVDKLYDATVIVEVGNNSDQISGWGSGFVYKTDSKYGYILTNHHVIEDARYIKVVSTNEKEVEGTLIGSDKYMDVAVVRVPLDSAQKVASIGKSEDLRLGDTVFTVGTPVSTNYSFTVTRGILSGKNRLCEMSSSNNQLYQYSQESWYINLLQIDASINGGNSGGPLANSNGEVVGITNSKLTSYYSSSTIENMAFAIPIEDAINIAEQLLEDGEVTRPLLGVSTAEVDDAVSAGLISNSNSKGAVVVKVADDSVADKAGLEEGDIILKLGDYEVTNTKYLKYYLYRYNVGDTVKITYQRNGKSKTVDVKLTDEAK